MSELWMRCYVVSVWKVNYDPRCPKCGGTFESCTCKG